MRYLLEKLVDLSMLLGIILANIALILIIILVIGLCFGWIK